MATSKKTAPSRSPARKPPAKAAPAAARRAARPAAAPKPAVVAAPAPKAAKADKPRKPKLVRDSFTIPKAEYGVLDGLKQRAARSGTAVKKSELLRAGIKALAAMGDPAFLAAVAAVPAIKTGRPAKG